MAGNSKRESRLFLSFYRGEKFLSRIRQALLVCVRVCKFSLLKTTVFFLGSKVGGVSTALASRQYGLSYLLVLTLL